MNKLLLKKYKELETIQIKMSHFREVTKSLLIHKNWDDLTSEIYYKMEDILIKLAREEIK